ncbi:MAG: hypothetical protein AAGB19_20845 [Cyanobacteria bacterium P01_F01_bin.3]
MSARSLYCFARSPMAAEDAIVRDKLLQIEMSFAPAFTNKRPEILGFGRSLGLGDQ